MIFTPLCVAFCKLGMKNTCKNAKCGCDLFNSFPTPVLSLFIKRIGNGAECRRKQPGRFLKQVLEEAAKRAQLEGSSSTLTKG